MRVESSEAEAVWSRSYRRAGNGEVPTPPLLISEKIPPLLLFKWGHMHRPPPRRSPLIPVFPSFPFSAVSLAASGFGSFLPWCGGDLARGHLGWKPLFPSLIYSSLSQSVQPARHLRTFQGRVLLGIGTEKVKDLSRGSSVRGEEVTAVTTVWPCDSGWTRRG